MIFFYDLLQCWIFISAPTDSDTSQGSLRAGTLEKKIHFRSQKEIFSAKILIVFSPNMFGEKTLDDRPVVREQLLPLLDMLGCGHTWNRPKPW